MCYRTSGLLFFCIFFSSCWCSLLALHEVDVVLAETGQAASEQPLSQPEPKGALSTRSMDLPNASPGENAIPPGTVGPSQRSLVFCHQEPTVEKVVAAALEHQSVGSELARSWQRRLGWSALLPQISTRLSRSVGQAELLDIRSETPGKLDLNNYLSLRWDVRAMWDLSRLVFDARELQVSSRAGKLADERRQLIERVVKLYFERCRLLELAHLPSSRSGEQILEQQLQFHRTTALLEAFTGGLFGKESLKP